MASSLSDRVDGWDNLYQFAPNTQVWVDWLGLAGVDMNLFPSNEDIHSYAHKVANKPNTFQVGGHGNPSLMVDGATGERLDAKKLAARIKKNPNYKSGMTVEILSCNTGKGTNLLEQQTIKNNTSYTSHLPKGVYILKVQTNKKNQTFKVISK